MATSEPPHSRDYASEGRATPEPERPEPPRRHPGTSLIVGALGIFSVVYLLNPTGGFIEFIPDVIPIFGNIDEAVITALLISCLAYFGIDVRRIFGFRVDNPRREKVVEVEGREER